MSEWFRIWQIFKTQDWFICLYSNLFFLQWNAIDQYAIQHRSVEIMKWTQSFITTKLGTIIKFWLVGFKPFIQSMILIYRRGNYDYHHWGFIWIYRLLSYPLRSLIGRRTQWNVMLLHHFRKCIWLSLSRIIINCYSTNFPFLSVFLNIPQLSLLIAARVFFFLGEGDVFFSRGDFFWEGGDNLLPNSYKPSPWPIRIFTVKENHIGTEVSEILNYAQSHPVTFL